MTTRRETATRKAVVCLWSVGQAEEAATFFPGSQMERIIWAPDGIADMAAGAVQIVGMTLCGLPYALLNGGQQVQPNDAYSLHVCTEG